MVEENKQLKNDIAEIKAMLLGGGDGKGKET